MPGGPGATNPRLGSVLTGAGKSLKQQRGPVASAELRRLAVLRLISLLPGISACKKKFRGYTICAFGWSVLGCIYLVRIKDRSGPGFFPAVAECMMVDFS